MSVEKVELYSDSSFRFRPVGAVEYTTVPGGRTEVVEIEHGTSLEVSSTNDNATIRISGDIEKVDIIESKLTDFSNMIMNSKLSTLIVSSESKIETVSKMISRSIVSDVQIHADISAATGKDEMVHLSVINNDEPINDITSFGNSIVSVVKPRGYIAGLEDAEIVDGDILNLENTISLDTIGGKDISAFKDFDIPRGRGQSIVPGVYNRIKSADTDTYTFEMYMSLQQKSLDMIRDNIENNDFVFNTTSDIDNYTFEIDISLQQKSLDMIRDNIENNDLVFDTTSDTDNYTFEMDIYNPHTLQ